VVGLHLVLSLALVAAARTLATRRDLGAGLFAARPGKESSRMSSPWNLTLRLHRSAVFVWTCAVAAMSLLFGVMAPGFDDLLDTSAGQELIDRLGGAFIAALLPISAMVVSVFAVTVVNRAQRDENEGRTPLALASGATRRGWFTATGALAMLGSVWLLAVSGSALWLGYRTAGGAGTPAVSAALGWAPAVGVILGLALVGMALRLEWLGWVALVTSVTLTLVGELLELPDWLVDLSPFSAPAAYPVESWTWTPLAVLSIGAATLASIAWRVFARRDIG
jgi:ABC-2 type transport system permease protein